MQFHRRCRKGTKNRNGPESLRAVGRRFEKTKLRFRGSIRGFGVGRRGDSKTTPEDCARVMLHAIEARSPKPRYGVTPLARLVKFGKRFLSDKQMDAILRSKYGITRDL